MKRRLLSRSNRRNLEHRLGRESLSLSLRRNRENRIIWWLRRKSQSRNSKWRRLKICWDILQISLRNKIYWSLNQHPSDWKVLASLMVISQASSKLTRTLRWIIVRIKMLKNQKQKMLTWILFQVFKKSYQLQIYRPKNQMNYSLLMIFHHQLNN